MKSICRIFPLVGHAVMVAALTACGGSSGSSTVRQESLQPGVSTSLPIATDGNGGTTSSPSAETDDPADAESPLARPGLSLFGVITFDHVPFDTRRYKGLNYSGTEARPVRGATVQLVDSQERVIANTQTDANGEYRFTVEENAEVRVRVLAELVGQHDALWDIKVRDNTQANAQYVLDGARAIVGSNSQQRDLHARSGWTGAGYTEPRSAAPFAVLDSIYSALQTVLHADPHIILPPLNVFWSSNNIAMRGELTKGQVGTSFFTSAGPSIYILGAADNDSDEYDRAVVQHEFAHYLEHEIARSESIGGSHNISSRLDLRVAFAEAWGNAFAGIVSGDPLYRDSLGPSQSSGFVIDVENTSFGRQGWFSEDSIQSFLYDLFGQTLDGNHKLGFDFRAIYEVMSSDSYLSAPGVASIYTFAEVLKQQNPDQQTVIDQRLTDAKIFGRGWLGDGESNHGEAPHALPVFTRLMSGETREVCSDNSIQEYNGLSVRRLLVVTLPDAGRYTFTAIRSGGALTEANPQLRLLQTGSQLAWSRSTSRNVETFTRSLEAGDYVLEVYEETNIDRDKNSGGVVCFNVTVQ